jgi:hypothetical protein
MPPVTQRQLQAKFENPVLDTTGTISRQTSNAQATLMGSRSWIETIVYQANVSRLTTKDVGFCS